MDSDIGKIEAFGFQAGADGFLQYGIVDPLDYLFMRVNGGRGSGKTMAGAYRLVIYVEYFPGSFGMVTAPIYDTITRSTLPSIFKAFGTVGMRRGKEFEYTENRKELEVYNGSKVFFGTTEIPHNLPGPDLHYLWMDEPRVSPEVAFLNLQPTLRRGGGYPRQAWFTSTPSGRRWWLRKIFHPEEFIAEFGEEAFGLDIPDFSFGEYKTYHAHTWDNPFPRPESLRPEQEAKLSPEEVKFHYLGGGMKLYLTTVRNYGGPKSLLSRQELFGEELMMEGLMYPTWDAEYHVKPEAEWPVKKPRITVSGVDFGFENPFVDLVVGRDGEGRTYILQEFVKSRLSEKMICDEGKKSHKKWDTRFFFCDDEDPGKIRAMRWAGLPARKAKKSKASGIERCTRSLNYRLPDGSQGFFVSPSCINFRREIESWVKDEVRLNRDPSELPKTGGHHVMDAWEYAEEGMERLYGKQGKESSQIRQLETTLA